MKNAKLRSNSRKIAEKSKKVRKKFGGSDFLRTFASAFEKNA